MATTKLQRNIKKRFWLSSLLLCVSVPLWFKNAAAQEKLPPETEAKIRAVLDSSPLKGAHVGLSILDLGTVKNAQSFPARRFVGKPFRVLFDHDADKKFMPASNMKLFTAAITLELLGKDKTFPTRVVTDITANRYILRLRLIGGGNPALSHEDLQELAKSVAARLEARPDKITGDGSAFSAETFRGSYPFGWTMDDMQWYYGPEINALAVDRNQIDVTITGADVAGSLAQIKTSLSPSDILLLRQVQTVQLHDKTLPFEKAIGWKWVTQPVSGELFLLLEGQVAPRQVIAEGIAMPDSAPLAAFYLSKFLNSIPYGASNTKIQAPYSELEEVAVHNSPPLKVLFQRLLKNSDNLYAEMLLRDAAYYYDKTGGDKAGPRAHELLKKWLISQNIDTTDLRFEDGSGLSRYNLLTPRATAELLAAINRMKDGDVIWNALPIAGIDGTMKKRLTSTPGRSNLATGNVRAKSGTFSIASNLSGYVTTRADSSGVRHRLAVSIYMNFPRDTDSAQAAQDKIFAILANSR